MERWEATHRARPGTGVEGTHVEGGLTQGSIGSIKEAIMKGKGQCSAMGDELHTEELSKGHKLKVMGTWFLTVKEIS